MWACTILACMIFCATLWVDPSFPGQNLSAVPVNLSPSAMEPLLKARKTVGRFFEQSANVVCSESVTQAIVGKNGSPSYREESKYNYQLQASSTPGSVKLVESREVRKQAFRDSGRTLLLTKGFASLLLIAHSQYESSYEFTPAGDDNEGATQLAKFNFKPVPGGASPAALQLRGKNYPLPLSGTIWIDKGSGAITRLTAAVDSSMADLGLKGMQSDIHYVLVQFHDPEEAYWMPASASIDFETPLQHWRNIHRFAAYKRFVGSIHVEGIEDEKR
jgi:hypothetical protein